MLLLLILSDGKNLELFKQKLRVHNKFHYIRANTNHCIGKTRFYYFSYNLRTKLEIKKLYCANVFPIIKCRLDSSILLSIYFYKILTSSLFKFNQSIPN